jgi:steroid delta-isomerase-like uncharacterized protein
MASLTELVREVFAALDRNDRDRVRELIDPDCDFMAPGFSGGRDDGMMFMGAFLDAFPGIQHHILNVFESGDRVATELEVVGTHTAPLHGPAGTIPATGKTVNIASCNAWKVRDGKVASYHAYFDTGAMMAQLGLGQG